jgi:diguanylate cyclase (GGDEF)-like protein
MSRFKGVFGKKHVFLHELVKDPVAVFDRDLFVVDVNEPMAKLLGLDRGSAAGRRADEIRALDFLGNELAMSVSGFEDRSFQASVGGASYKATIHSAVTEEGTRLWSLALQDITRFINIEDELVKRNRMLMVINTLSTAFIYSDEMGSVLDRLIEKVLLVTDLDLCWIVLRSGEGFVPRGASGVSIEFREKLEKGKLDRFHLGVIESAEPLVVLEQSGLGGCPDIAREGAVFVVAQALSFGPDKAGVLALGSRSPVKVDFDMASLIHLIGNHVSLILEKVRLYEEAERLAVTDALTGIFNVRYFYDALGMEMARARRYGSRFSLSIFDIDDFKSINDRFGHQAGDEVLRQVASVMRKVSRESDVVARYGGEEFVVLLPNTARDEALKQATRVKDAVERTEYLKEGITITMSGGVATYPEDAEDEKKLLYAADMALYDAKAMGKRRIRFAGGDR